MVSLVKKARAATGRHLDGMAQAVHDRAQYRKGDTLFKKNDDAHEMLLMVTGIPG